MNIPNPKSLAALVFGLIALSSFTHAQVLPGAETQAFSAQFQSQTQGQPQNPFLANAFPYCPTCTLLSGQSALSLSASPLNPAQNNSIEALASFGWGAPATERPAYGLFTNNQLPNSFQAPQILGIRHPWDVPAQFVDVRSFLAPSFELPR